ncbi:hypothetical protein CK203_030390 [Vitis vinifera]|uniref:Retrotransposon gag domain-containing protein n=1 Tax=Vitis vinifera TaxID=29760 RepID=A0A438IV41_VITVI|nr:hypothetical protein CK203_030390 [Vitis vinifera]
MPREVHTTLHYGRRHEKGPELSRESRKRLRSGHREACRALTWRRLANKPVGGRPSLLHGAGAEVRRIHLVMLLPTWRQGSQGGASHGRHPGRGGLDRARHGEGLEDLREQIQDLRRGAGLASSAGVTRGVHVLPRQDAVSARVMATHEAPRVEVPKPHTFSGKRDAKELDNFLWHMERYFEAIALTDEATKRERTCTIDTWDAFKREIKRQFYPEDVAYLARKSLKRLKHTGSIREYVKEFSTLMLEIPNMAEEELLFNFMDNLQSWAEQELRRRGVQDLATAMAVAESLVDYRRGDSSKPKPPSKGNQAKGGGDKRSQGHTLRKDQAKALVARMAKARTSERSSRQDQLLPVRWSALGTGLP